MGGDVSIKRLVGTTIDMDAGGGDIYVGSLYGNGAHLLILERQSIFFNVVMSFQLMLLMLFVNKSKSLFNTLYTPNLNGIFRFCIS